MTRFICFCRGAITLTSLAACAPSQPAQIHSPTPVAIASPVAISPAASPVPVRKPNGSIGTPDQMGIIINVGIPSDPACHKKYQNVAKETFDRCLVMGMTYAQVANRFGFAGTL